MKSQSPSTKTSSATLFIAGIIVWACAVMPQTANGTMQVENLNRGLIAIRVGQGYYLSWRLLANEPYTTGFNVYRGTTRLNNTPLTGGTNYRDQTAALNSVYTVRAIVGGVEQPASESAFLINNTDGPNAGNTSGETAGYIHIDLQRPPTGQHGGTYTPNDGSTGDLTGNGVYDIVLKWDPSNAQDNANSGTTDNVLIDAYTLTGTRLWRIDLGPNIRAGAHYTQFMVYDFDGCGKAEIIMKTAPGTRDGTGKHINMGPAASADHDAIYRNSSGYILTGPEYITVFDGETGRELATADYWPARGTVSSWGDNYGNRVDRFNAVVAYVDGERPTAVFQRGYYTRMTFAAWDWRNGQLTRRWTFDSNASGNSAYAGQGNHSLSVADVDNSGKHSIITGSAVIGPDGRGMHTKGYGHGDALHVAHMIKGNPYPQIFMPHESGNIGVSLRHANNGQELFTVSNSGDVGRGVAAYLDPAYPGFQFWAASGMGLYDMSGQRIGNQPNNGNTGTMINFLVWWDGTLARANLDGNQIASWRIGTNTGSRLLTASGAGGCNGTKNTPVLTADLFGDWREEVVLRHGDNALRIYTTTSPTTHRLVTLMHDPTYRVAVAWQNSSYNQPPHPGYYIASDMDFPPPPLNVVVVGSGTPPPPLPTANITAPANNAWFMPGQSIAINATASQSGSGTISQVEFFSGTTKLGERTSTPYNFTWTNPPAGVHTITVRATNNTGQIATSAARTISVAALIGSGTFIDSLILFDITPPNTDNWSIRNNFGVSVKAYGDREFQTITVSQELVGAEWISPAAETRRLTAPDTIIRFKMKKSGVVYVAHEDRVTTRPAWINARGFTATNRNISINDGSANRTFTVYGKTFQQGETVAMGRNSNDGTTTSLMYLVAVTEIPSTSITNNIFPTNYSINVGRDGAGMMRIDYAVKNAGSVRLDVFDIKGNRVKTLVNSSKDAGVYQERLSTKGLAAGTYLLRLNVGGGQVLQTRILIAK